MRRIALGVAGVMLTIAGLAAQQPRTRETTPDQYKWNLAEIFATDEAWQAEKARLSQEFAKARDFKGTLSQSAARLQQALDLQTAQDKAFNRVAAYAEPQGGPGHAQFDLPGHEGPGDPDGCHLWGRVGVPGTRNPGDGSGNAR